jgi:hypothetical protein
MYFVIQFYLQLRTDLAAHQPFLKVLAIKLVIFLSFWQTFAISILSSTSLLQASAKLAYPDIAVGIPSLLLCIEMSLFALLHLWAFPWKVYIPNGGATKYPSSVADPEHPAYNAVGEKQGGFMGLKAFVDAMNPWDLVKAFARGMRWLFVGRKTRESDPSYKHTSDVVLEPQGTGDNVYASGGKLPIADEFARNGHFPNAGDQSGSNTPRRDYDEEGAGLISNAQPDPVISGGSVGPQGRRGSGYVPARQRYDAEGREFSPSPPFPQPGRYEEQGYDGEIGMAVSEHSWSPSGSPQYSNTPMHGYPDTSYHGATTPVTAAPHPTTQHAHAMLWGAQNQAPQPQEPQDEYARYNAQQKTYPPQEPRY